MIIIKIIKKNSFKLALLIGLVCFSQNINVVDVFSSENSPIIYDDINCLELDSYNQIWAGTSQGLSIFNFENNEWYNFDSNLSIDPWCCENNLEIMSLEWADEINTMFVGTNIGIISYSNSSSDISFSEDNWEINIGGECSANNNIINTILYDDRIWAGGTDGLCVQFFQGKEEWTLFNTQTGFFSNNYKSIKKNNNSGLIGIGTMNGGLITYSGEFINYYSENSGILDNSILDLAFDLNDNIIVTSPQAGLGILTNTGNWIWLNTVNSNIISNSLKNVIVDGNNSVWITTLQDGISQYYNNNFYNYNTDNSSLIDNEINCLIVDNEENLWLGTKNSGLIRIETFYSNISEESVDEYQINFKKNKISITSQSCGHLNIFDISGKLVHNHDFLAGESEISTQVMKPGFYLFKIIIKGSVSTKKFIKN